MEFEDQEDQDEEMEIQTASYDSLGNSSRVVLAPSPLNGNNNNREAVTTPTTATTATLLPSPNNHNSQTRKPLARYRECQKNHAVGIGGHAVDGCGEFMPAGLEGTLDALKCAACNCHRNFHRKETTPNDVSSASAGVYFPHAGGHHPQFAPYYRTPAGYLQMGPAQQRPPPPPPLALPSTTSTHSREFLMDQEDMSNPGFGGSSSGRKRFRTKFTQDQKEKMLALAEKLGWRIQKHDEAAVQQFCNETGVKRHVLKVWMHNNKHTLEPRNFDH